MITPNILKKINHAVKVLRQGGIIIYPTEGVYGLGCDPCNETAVLRLLKLKQRSITKGLILIAANWQQVQDLVRIDLAHWATIKKTDSPTTWLMPATKKTPSWITGKFNAVAIRVTLHPLAKKICQKFGGPIVSTSANLTNKPAIKSLKHLDVILKDHTDFIVQGPTSGLGKPTRICEVKTGKIVRA